MALHSETGEISGKKLHDEVLQGDPVYSSPAHHKLIDLLMALLEGPFYTTTGCPKTAH